MSAPDWIRRLLVLGFGGVLMAGSVMALLLSEVAGAETQQRGTPLSNPTTRTTQADLATKITPEQEAALVEVRKILREASEMAQGVVIENPESKEGKFLVNNNRFVLSGIVGAQARAGDIEGARLTTMANGEGISLAIAIAQAKAGRPHEALKAVDPRNLRQQPLQVIAEALHKSGDGRTALEVIENVYVPWDRAEALFLYARFLAKTGDPAANEIAHRAYAFFNTLAKGQPWVYVRLAEFQVDAGDLTASLQSFQKARAAALAVPDVQQQLKSLNMVAKAQAQNMDQPGSEKTYAEAIRIAKGLPAKQQEIELGDIARTQLALGNRASAAETVRLILQVPSSSSPREQALRLTRQASWDLAFQEQEAARKALQAALPQVKVLAESPSTSESDRDYIYWDIARLAAKAGALETVNQALALIKKDERKISAMREVVEVLVHALPSGEVTRTIRLLADTAKDITSRLFTSPNDLTLKNVAIIQAAVGDLKSATRTANRIEDVNHGMRERAYMEMAEVLINEADWKSAQQVVAGIKQHWSATFETYRKLARAQVKAGDGKNAADWTRQQEVPLARAYALLGVAESLMDVLSIEPLLPTVHP